MIASVILCLKVKKKKGGGGHRRRRMKTGRCVCVIVSLFMCASFSCTCGWMFDGMAVRRVSGQAQIDNLCVLSITNKSHYLSCTLCRSVAIIGAHRGRKWRNDKQLFGQLPVYSTTLSVQICITLCLLSSVAVGVACVLKDRFRFCFTDIKMEFMTTLFEAHRQTKSSFWW